MTLNSPVSLPCTAIGHRDWQLSTSDPPLLCRADCVHFEMKCVEDEKHFLLECSLHDDLGFILFPKCSWYYFLT